MKYTYEQLQSVLEEGMPVPTAYSSFDEEQSGNYACWITDEIEQYFADNEIISSEVIIRLELYTRTKDTELEDQVEDFLANGLEVHFWKDEEIWLDDEEVFMINYYFSIRQGVDYEEMQSE